MRGERPQLFPVEDLDPVQRLWRELPAPWRGPVIGPGIENWAAITENGEGYFLTQEMMTWFGEQYLGAGDTLVVDAADPAVSPLFTPDLAGVAPALVVTAGYDPLRDEGDAYAARLAEAGVAVTHQTNDTLIHDFFGMDAASPAAAAAVAAAAEQLRAALAG